MGRIDDNKGIFTLLEVLAENKSLFNERIMLNIAGNGETDRMNKYIKDNCISSLVNYHGWADEKKKAELLNLQTFTYNYQNLNLSEYPYWKQCHMGFL